MADSPFAVMQRIFRPPRGAGSQAHRAGPHRTAVAQSEASPAGDWSEQKLRGWGA
jgi:hypothetical protein